MGAGGSVFYGDAADDGGGAKAKDDAPKDSVESLNVELMVCM